MTADELAEAEAILARLLEHGYAPVDQCGRLAPGVRIRHRGHQWPEACARGTGVVHVITEKPDSAWSRSWGMRDVELIAVWDKPWPLDSRLSQLAQYHVCVVEVAE